MKRRLLAIFLSLTLMLSLIPSAWAVENGEPSQEPAVYVREDNPYSDDGITIDGVTVAEGLATVKVSYAKANQMAGIAYSYTVDGEEVTDRAIAQQIDGDGIPQTDKNNINGYLRDCTVYTFPVEEGGTDITVTVDGSTFWDYDAETKTLTISGEGSMANFTYMTISDAEETVDEQCLASFPWAEYKNEVENVIVKDDITRIGNQAFRKFFALKNLTVASKELLEIGNTVCMNNSALKVVDLTACTKLAKIGSGMLTYVTNDAYITVKMAAPVAGLWRGGDNYLKANTIFTYDKDGTVIVDNWECLISGSECEIVAYKGSATEVVIPASIVYDDKTYKVALIDGGLFQNNTEITSVAFAEGSQITAIPDSFMSCADLRPSGHGNAKSVILPSGIETIGASAFAMYSQNLTTFQIGNDATCIDLTKIKSIGTFGLANLSTNHLSTKDVKISGALKSIGSEAFKNNRFGKLVLTAGDYGHISVHSNAFGSLYLTNGIELESGVKNADAIIDAVLNAKKVTKFTQLFKDGKSAVYTVDYANKTVSLELSSSLNAENFAEKSWHGYTVLLSETITNDDVWEIQCAIANGEKICTIIGYHGWGGAIEIPAKIKGHTVKAIGDEVFKDNSTITKVTFEDSSQCEEIGNYAFGSHAENISALKEIVFPKTLKKIGNNAFYFSALEEFPALPDGLTTIGAQAFYNSRSAKADLLAIPETVTEIGNQAFRWCGAIRNVWVNSTTLNLGCQAFLLTTGRNGYIDLSAVKNLTMAKETDDTNTFFTFGGISTIYVADDSIAAMMNDEVNYPKTFDKTTTSIISVNGGTVSENPTGLSSVTRKDGNTTYTAVWYEDGEEMTNPTTNLKAGSTYSVKWVAAIDGGYQVAAIADQTYTGAEIEPAVVVTDSEGNVLEDGYTVTYTDNVDVGTATAKVTIGSKLVEVSFNILKDMNPTVTMGGGSVTYGEAYELKPSAATSTGKTIDGKIVIKYYTDAKCTEELEEAPTEAGTYYAKATLEGTENYASATSEPAKIEILNATFSVKADAYVDTYDGKPHTVTVTADGAKISYSADAGNYKTYGSTAPTFTDVGEYTLTPAGGSAKNYTFNYVSGTLTILRRPSNPGSTISVPSTPNGTVTVTPSTATKDTTVTITTKPNEGYELGDLTVKDANGNALPLTDKGDGKYTFTMPGSKVVVEASFVKTAVSTGFADVPADAYFADAVKWAVDKGVTNGLSDTMFGPYESCTRAQIVTFLWRAAGSPEPKTVSSFTDVPASAYYAKAVAWAVENGITNGMTETTFAPDATCTRGQSVTFLYRALKGTASGSTNFTDVKSDAFYTDAINWAVANNVTNGTSNTTFSPNADCTRAEIVTFLYRAYQGK